MPQTLWLVFTGYEGIKFKLSVSSFAELFTARQLDTGSICFTTLLTQTVIHSSPIIDLQFLARSSHTPCHGRRPFATAVPKL